MSLNVLVVESSPQARKNIIQSLQKPITRSTPARLRPHRHLDTAQPTCKFFEGNTWGNLLVFALLVVCNSSLMTTAVQLAVT